MVLARVLSVVLKGCFGVCGRGLGGLTFPRPMQ